ncbi:MAG TPA: chorismate synthase [Bacteroidetes bacterium]|nr:chorismate synthase [Bacteroidota bacterium]
MVGNSFGHRFRITTFGESHGPAMGVVIDGCPAGLSLKPSHIQEALDRRRPGQSNLTTARKEKDQVEILSGVFEDKTLGSPITLLIRNQDARPKDYNHLKEIYRPSHADYTYLKKYGHRDPRGGGRASARETACRVAAGAVAKRVLDHLGIDVYAFTHQIGQVVLEAAPVDYSSIEHHPTRCPKQSTADAMQQAIESAKTEGDSLGGVIECHIIGLPVGLGQPVFHRFEADLAFAMLSINATKSFEIGSGIAGTKMKGSEHNDPFIIEKDKVATSTNFSGGVQGGITNGMPVTIKVGFKPTATIQIPQESINQKGKKAIVEGKGRHDPCVIPRAVPIVEAMANLVTVDHILLAQSDTIEQIDLKR